MRPGGAVRNGCFALAGALIICAPLLCTTPAFATTPGHNGRILFGAVTDDGSSQLFLTGPHGHATHQITHVTGDAVHPDWSPNGRWIAFELDRSSGCDLVLIRPNGTHMRTLPHPPGRECDEQPSFTPSGDRLLFSSYDPAIDDEAIWVSDWTAHTSIDSARAAPATPPIPTPHRTGHA